MPEVTVGAVAARLVFLSRDRLVVELPDTIDGGEHLLQTRGTDPRSGRLEIGALVADGIHQVDSPAVGPDGTIYLTYSGSRGQETLVSVFRVGATGGREAFVSGIVNATSLAVDREGRLLVSSRFDGTLSRVTGDGEVEVIASELGRACGLAVAPDDTIFVGDRSGTIFHVERDGTTRSVATLPASVAAFHLALGPDGALFVTAPTLAPRDHVYRVDPSGRVEVFASGFGRPQGLAMSPKGELYVVEALAGASGVYHLPSGGGTPRLVVAGRHLLGVAFGPGGELVVCSSDAAYRFSAASLSLAPLVSGG